FSGENQVNETPPVPEQRLLHPGDCSPNSAKARPGRLSIRRKMLLYQVMWPNEYRTSQTRHRRPRGRVVRPLPQPPPRGKVRGLISLFLSFLRTDEGILIRKSKKPCHPCQAKNKKKASVEFRGSLAGFPVARPSGAS